MPRPKPTREAALKRLLEKCNKIPDSCWIWPGATSGFGYPVANLCGRGTFTYLHREVYEQFVGSIPAGFEVDHACSNKRCLNPLHLQALSHGDNVSREGTCGQHRKIDYQQVAYLRNEGVTVKALAEKFGVCDVTIYNAIKEFK